MIFFKIKRIFNTIKYLKIKQITYRIYYILRDKFFIKKYKIGTDHHDIYFLKNYDYYNPSSRLQIENKKLTFLNKTYIFEKEIDWNFNKYGKLWVYNLNYFDFLNQPDLTKVQGLNLIKDYVKKKEEIKDGLEPYPISLRTINWIKFLSNHKIKDTNITNHLLMQYSRLIDNLEYHLLGNHLLENGFSLLYGAYFFKNETFYKLSKRVIMKELEEQILSDGAHFELSPMYHQIMLYRVLDSIFLIQINEHYKDLGFLNFLKDKAASMLSWLGTVTYNNGNIPMVNDSTYGIAPSSAELFKYALKLNIESKTLKLSESGYRKIKTKSYELFFDVGQVGPPYQPAHAHSDTFSFEFYLNNQPVIVDTGISTYEKNKKRITQRSTSSHNTVTVDGEEQTDVWGGFRVGRRAIPKLIYQDSNRTIATHNGYTNIGITHKRTFTYLKNQIIIEDEMLGKEEAKNVVHLHFHPEVGELKIANNLIFVTGLGLKIYFEGEPLIINKELYNYCIGFNETKAAFKVAVEFKNKVITNFVFREVLN